MRLVNVRIVKLWRAYATFAIRPNPLSSRIGCIANCR